MKNANIEKAYAAACERYAELGVDVEKAIKKLEKVPVSLHCWQSDDVGGFEKPDASLSGGGIQTTGNYPGKARNIGELKEDLKKAYSLIPGQKRLNLHAIYGEFGGKLVDRDQIEPKHFQGWVDFAKEQNIKLDFNSTLFSHPKADAGYTLSSLDNSIRDFWIEHTQRCRRIAAFMGKELNATCFHNIWIPDGSKDITVERYAHRA
ncbi:MAG: L-rhamnose isomerase, partial [Bacteroidota bacterium]|nr:L-rhamnose isomerase [Bacteroidota bacterium]